jgi:hypothetical protein
LPLRGRKKKRAKKKCAAGVKGFYCFAIGAKSFLSDSKKNRIFAKNLLNMEIQKLDKETSDKISFITFIVPEFALAYKMGMPEAYQYLTFWRGGTIVKEPLAYDYSFDGINDAQAVGKYSKMIGGQSTGLDNINKATMNDLYHSIGTDKVLVSYPTSGGMNHMVNVQGAYRQIITYPSGSTGTKIMYYVLDNGKQLVRSASYFRGGNFFRIILP